MEQAPPPQPVMLEDEGLENPQPQQIPVFPEQLIQEIEDGISDSDLKVLGIFARNHILIPLGLSCLVVIAFWSIWIHGSIFIFLAGSAAIFILSITRVQDIPRLLPPTVARNGLRMLEIRMIQVFLMYFYVLLITTFKQILPIISKLFSNYFRNSENLGKDALAFFSGTGAYSAVPWTAYVQISNQVFWLSLTWMVVSRTILNLFLMAQTPSFRTLLRYESNNTISLTINIWIGVILFNKAANNLKGTPPGSLVLLLTLLLWTVSTLFRSATKDELVIIRRNNFYGIMRVMTVILCQAGVSTLLASLMDLVTFVTVENLSIKISPSSPDSDIRDYWNAVQLQKFKPDMKKNVIELNLNLLTAITFIVCMSRFIKHKYEVDKLERMLHRLVLLDAEH